ncbi:Receptor protein kinase, putative isoform 2 [Hibiscus syriacus]|uniref:RING-type E3 ubiquitin transferase n=1 Tax=Hibiscus syriacus TaxID=106335 RepID=A0A6A3ALF1_HIBSY|nr:U-box domain-containing protein 32-like isoform X1 [Hibiscus syriacus]KAE8704703.1 Receptor protein kinase, putative isoform 2 [Hibiscus syriacus]
MGSLVGEIEGERENGVEEVIFVAVGRNVEKSKTTLNWAVDNFPGKKICVLHVHRPTHVLASTDRKLSLRRGKLKQHAVEAFQKLERQKLRELLDEYLLILDHSGVQADAVWIEMDSVEKGIAEIIARQNIRWLVMGAAADKYYSTKLVELKSKKAIFVCQSAPVSCHIWFVCKGCLIYTRVSRKEGSSREITTPSQPLDSLLGSEQSQIFLSESVLRKRLRELEVETNVVRGDLRPTSTHSEDPNLCSNGVGRKEGSSREITTPSPPPDSPLSTAQSEILLSESLLRKRLQELNIDTDSVRGNLRSCSWHLEHPNSSSSGVIDTDGSTLLQMDEEAEHQGQASNEIDEQVEVSTIYCHNLKQESFSETVRRRKEENDAMEAISKEEALESLCVKEMIKRKEMEEFLEREKQEIQKMKDQRDEFIKELQRVEGQRVKVESQIADYQCTAELLKDKMFSAVELLISFKKQRDEMRIEHGNAMRVLKKLRKLVNGGDASFPGTQILEFSFMEINNATRNFDPSWKIGEGRYGSVYKGFLRHLNVSIKMLPSYGSQSLTEFENEVEILCRVRHPNLVTIIGTCPESRSLVFEYHKNGSLEERLACKNKIPPLPWQTRIRIASEICSALVFLHSNKPCIPHGNLKPSKVLIDSNFVSKLIDSGIYRLIPQGENTDSSSSSCTKSTPKVASVYTDPVCLKSRKVTRESDVYSFGMILLRLLTGRPALGILKDVKCALETDNFGTVLDRTAGKWPLEDAELLTQLALRCCDKHPLNRPDMSEIWSLLGPVKDTCINSAPCLEAKELRRAPPHFVCPVFQDVMKDPLIAADGFTYEADAIRGWLDSGHDTSPMTNLKLDHCNLVPNYALQQAIQEWQQQY